MIDPKGLSLATIDDRWHEENPPPGQPECDCGTGQVGTKAHGQRPNSRFRVQYRDLTGKQRRPGFPTLARAKKKLKEVIADLEHKTYVDPDLSKKRVSAYLVEWLPRKCPDEGTQQQMETRMRLHVAPTLGAYEFRVLENRPDLVQEWNLDLQEEVSPDYARVIYGHAFSMFEDATAAGHMKKNPFRSRLVKAPRRKDSEVVVWPLSWVDGVREALPDIYRTMVDVGTGLGLRQGEIFGLSPDDVDERRGLVHVRRQVKIVRSKLVFALPKGRKVRTVPLALSVARKLKAHLLSRPARRVTLPWQEYGKPMEKWQTLTVSLIFTSRESKPLNRNYFNNLWKDALRKVGIPVIRANMMHSMRHFFASVLLEAGVTIKALADYLGHADVGFLLKTYCHLMPASHERMTKAVDHLFSMVDGLDQATGAADAPPDGLLSGLSPEPPVTTVPRAPRSECDPRLTPALP
ncbi:site-specific integrase [Streptomyces sp. WAC07149]|uniref:tyrosine-type recombinase/integrase n=1 Tax=Streptomyces sp. WAC07149 TaxID=2487425 RepID=UPI000F7AD266|nr:site-specific integrase [Streptomyces sp. WAC07149]RST00347.1 site-specific integrase [Streptomyces sp. WAC07149]